MEFLTQYLNLVILGICLCLGYVVKKWVPDVDNKLIPTVNAVLGVVLSVWISGWQFTPEIVLGGLFSALAATGLYEAFRQWVEDGGLMDKIRGNV